MHQRIPLGTAEATHSAEYVSSMYLRNDIIPPSKKLQPLSQTCFQPVNIAACFQKQSVDRVMGRRKASWHKLAKKFWSKYQLSCDISYFQFSHRASKNGLNTCVGGIKPCCLSWRNKVTRTVGGRCCQIAIFWVVECLESLLLVYRL